MMSKKLDEFLEGVEGENFREQCESICGALREWSPNYDWVGIYWLKGDHLKLGAWSGESATEHVSIPISEGICGAAVREGKTIIVDDVSEDERYLACFMDTKSEIVVPIFSKSKIVGEIDVDGKKTGAYSDEDREFLEALAKYIGDQFTGKR
jgi:L-methionine (R)-S-oxide reductase